MINAAGYVRVDEAEREPRRVLGAPTPWAPAISPRPAGGAACRSSRSHPIWCSTARRAARTSKSTRRARSNVYGASKAEAERRVLELLADALVIRTSAFFGPWDDAQLPRRALFDALERGEPFWRAADSVVSRRPTCPISSTPRSIS